MLTIESCYRVSIFQSNSKCKKALCLGQRRGDFEFAASDIWIIWGHIHHIQKKTLQQKISLQTTDLTSSFYFMRSQFVEIYKCIIKYMCWNRPLFNVFLKKNKILTLQTICKQRKIYKIFTSQKKKPTEDCEWALAVPVSSKSDQTNPWLKLNQYLYLCGLETLSPLV